MRNITCTSAILFAGAAVAAPPELGCYQRTYSAAHLAAQPQQQVQGLTLHIYDSGQIADPWAAMSVQMRDGTIHLQSLICFDSNGAPVCGVECDGGLMEITRQDGTGLTFRTDYLIVGDGDGCGGLADLAEVRGSFTTYALNVASAAICEEL